MRTRLLALGITAGIAIAAPAMAQQTRAPEVQDKRQFKLGVGLDTIYDTNVAHTSRATAEARGITPEDEIFRPNLQFDIVQPIGRNAAFLQGVAGYDFHRVNTRLDRENIEVTGGGQARAGPCQALGYGRYAIFQSDLQDLAQGLVQNTMATSTGGGQVTCKRGQGLTLQLSGDHQQVVNSADKQKQADHRTDSAAGVFTYENQTLGALGLVYNYSTVEFPSRLNAKGGIGDSFWNQLLGVSYSRRIGSKIKVQATAGRMTLKRDSAPPGIPLKVNGANYTAGLDYKMNNRLEFVLQGTRSFQPSNRPGKLFDLVTHTEATATYNLGTRIAVTLGGYVEDLRANQDTAALAAPTVTSSRKKVEYVSIRYRQSDRITGLLDVRQEDRRTDLPAFNYSDTRATVTLAASF